MQLFFTYCAEDPDKAPAGDMADSAEDMTFAEVERLVEVACDEELLMRLHATNIDN